MASQVSNVTPALAWQVCVFCKFKFCIEHAHARKHGCDEAIAKAGREKYGSGGRGTFGGGRPTRTGDELQRSVWSGPLLVGHVPTRESRREQHAYTCTGISKPVWHDSGDAKCTFWRFQT